MLYHLEDIEKIREVEKEVSNNGYKVFDRVNFKYCVNLHYGVE